MSIQTDMRKRAPVAQPRRAGTWRIRRQVPMYLLLALPLLYFFAFGIVPLFGAVAAFQDFSSYQGFFASPGVGWNNFQRVIDDPYFWTTAKNTLILGALFYVTMFPAQIVVALLFNEARHGLFRRVAQSMVILPFFLSLVAVVNMAILMLSPSTGIVNGVIRALGGHTINFMMDPNWFRPIATLINLWVYLGWNSIIFLAAMSAIDVQLYEAASVDGAGRLRRAWHVTLPGIRSTTITVFLLSLPLIIGFPVAADGTTQMALLLQQPITYTTSDLLGTYVFRQGLLNFDYGYATAVSVMWSLGAVIVVFSSNWLASRFSETSLW